MGFSEIICIIGWMLITFSKVRFSSPTSRSFVTMLMLCTFSKENMNASVSVLCFYPINMLNFSMCVERHPGGLMLEDCL